MGKSLTLLGIWLFINIFGLLAVLGITSVDPSNQCSTLLFDSGTLITPYVNNVHSTSDTWTYGNNISGSVPQSSSTNPDSNTAVFPDWINSGIEWITKIIPTLLNVVSAPYAFMQFITCGYPSLNAIAVLIGVALSIMNLFILVSWMLGRID